MWRHIILLKQEKEKKIKETGRYFLRVVKSLSHMDCLYVLSLSYPLLMVTFSFLFLHTAWPCKPTTDR